MTFLLDLGFACVFVLMLFGLCWGLIYFENRTADHHQRVIRRATGGKR